MASEKRINVGAFSNWEVSDDKTLYDSITIDNSFANQIQMNALEIPLESVVTVESCIQLIKSNDEACILNLNTTSPNEAFKVLTIVSGSKYIELSIGALREYHSTHKGELLDDFEGVIIYKAQITLGTPTSKCSLKLLQFTPPDSLWIYGLHIIYTQHGIPIFNDYRKSNHLDSSSDTEPIINKNISSVEHDQNQQLCDMSYLLNKYPEKNIADSMKNYIDSKFVALENKLFQRFSNIENNQHRLIKLIEDLQLSVLTNKNVSRDVNE